MKRILLLYIFLIASLGYSQNVKLKEAIQFLEKKHHVNFSYGDATLEKYTIDASYKADIELHEILAKLSLNTNLVFEELKKGYYIIRKKKSKKVNICGNVITDVPLYGATVVVDGKGAITDENGNFQLSDVENDSYFQVSFLGYETQTLAVKDFVSCNSITLKVASQELSEVLISDYLTQGMTKKLDGSISVSPKKLGILPGVVEADVLQSMQLLPGVQSPDETASGLHIRGSTPDQNLVIYDGMKMYHNSHFFGMISVFNPYVTNDVKLFRSGTQAKYGNSIGGVLDINSGKYVPQKFTAGFGSNFTHADFYLKTPLFKGKLGLILSGRRAITDIVNSITYEQFSEAVFQNSRISETEGRGVTANNTFFFQDYSVKLIYDFNKKNKFVFSNLYNLNDLNFERTKQRRRRFERTMDDLEVYNFAYRFSWLHQFNEKWKQEVAFNHTYYDLFFRGSRELTATRNRNQINTSSASGKDNQVLDQTVQYDLTYQKDKKSSVELGYQYTFNDLIYLSQRLRDNGELNKFSQDGKDDIHAIYAEYRFNDHKKWVVNTGLRLQSFHSFTLSFLEPRLHASYKVFDGLRVKLSAELKHQNISQASDFRDDGSADLIDEFWVVSDGESFPLLNSRQFSTGFVFSDTNWAIDIEGYIKKIDGLLFQTADNRPLNRIFDVGQNNMWGIDVLLKRKWKSYSTWLSYTYSKSVYSFSTFNNLPDQEFPGDFDIPHSLIWSHNIKYKGFEASLGWRYHTGIPYTEQIPVPSTVGTNRLRLRPPIFNGKRVPDYHRLDASATYHFFLNAKKTINAKLGVSLLNLTNAKNILEREFEIIRSGGLPQGQEEEIDELDQIDRISIGFVPNVVFRINFK